LNPESAITLIPHPAPAFHWLDHFSREAAVVAVSAYIAMLGSSRHPEQSTRVVYAGGLTYLLDWLADELPTLAVMQDYVAHLVQRGLARSTINARYLAVARHYLRALADQHQPGLTGAVRDFVADCAMQMRQAAAIKPPPREVSTNIAPLWNPKFKRLSLDQVNTVLSAIDRESLIGLRDYALLRIAFATGLRVGELQRLTLENIRSVDEETYLIQVRGKRNNFDPVSIDAGAYAAILEYVQAFNGYLYSDDPRRIGGSVPIWQVVHRYGTPYPLNFYDPCKGLSKQALRDMMGDRTERVLGAEWRLSPHDYRRTAASLAYTAKMAIEDIQKMLRHASITTTMKYIGVEPKYDRQTLGRLVRIG
jgi:integrase